jgi:hypothetical protein
LGDGLPEGGAAERHQFLVGGDDGLAVGDGGFDDLAGDGGAADSSATIGSTPPMAGMVLKTPTQP